MRVYYDRDADINLIKDKKIVIAEDLLRSILENCKIKKFKKILTFSIDVSEFINSKSFLKKNKKRIKIYWAKDKSKLNLSEFKKIIKNKSINKAALFSSVVPKYHLILRKFLKRFYNIKLREIKEKTFNKIVKINIKNNNQVGSDRIANAVGVYKKYKSNCIVLDFGTATTFDVVIKNNYLGGIIAPGVNLSLNTLIKKADQIPSFTLKKINKVVGNNTISALRSGFYWGYAGLIENILQLIRKETKRNYKIILTGGFASLFKNSIKSKVFIDKDITMKGLIEILKVK